MAKILVSACLLGCNTRYDAKQIPCQKVIDLAKDNILIPVCPEQLGGLPTPRHPSERQGNTTVTMNDGTDVTENYKNGAQIALQIAKLNKVDYCILKSQSPSCGSGIIYDGTFSGGKIEGDGVTTELLRANGFKVISENDL